MAESPEEALAAWGENAQVEAQLRGGTRSDVWAVRIDDRPYALRKSRRSPEALAWELSLVEYLTLHGIGAPSILRARHGARTVGAFFAETWVNGHPPQTESEWREVERVLRRMHQLTSGWSQRPTFASCIDLLTQDRGGDVDLTAMPPEAVERCRQAWRALVGAPLSAIHGDPRGNVLIADAGVVFIDWDEARVDASVLDMVDLPVTNLSTTVQRAASAWEAATSWTLEPEYARRRLAELY